MALFKPKDFLKNLCNHAKNVWNSTKNIDKKNSSYERHWISQPMWIVAPLLFMVALPQGAERIFFFLPLFWPPPPFFAAAAKGLLKCPPPLSLFFDTFFYFDPPPFFCFAAAAKGIFSKKRRRKNWPPQPTNQPISIWGEGRGGLDACNLEHHLILRFDNRFPTHRPGRKKKHAQVDIYLDLATTRPTQWKWVFF